jgi:hypothetical protein
MLQVSCESVFRNRAQLILRALESGLCCPHERWRVLPERKFLADVCDYVCRNLAV